MSNDARADRLDDALAELYPSRATAEALRDLLADARHLCDRVGLNYADADRMAEIHHADES